MGSVDVHINPKSFVSFIVNAAKLEVHEKTVVLLWGSPVAAAWKL